MKWNCPRLLKRRRRWLASLHSCPKINSSKVNVLLPLLPPPLPLSIWSRRLSAHIEFSHRNGKHGDPKLEGGGGFEFTDFPLIREAGSLRAGLFPVGTICGGLEPASNNFDAMLKICGQLRGGGGSKQMQVLSFFFWSFVLNLEIKSVYGFICCKLKNRVWSFHWWTHENCYNC